jgi:hypothetical protein
MEARHGRCTFAIHLHVGDVDEAFETVMPEEMQRRYTAMFKQE